MKKTKNSTLTFNAKKALLKFSTKHFLIRLSFKIHFLVEKRAQTHTNTHTANQTNLLY